MKKFGLGLSQLMGPSSSDERHMASNMMPTEDEGPPLSPYPGRRAPLPSKVEFELRAACIAVLTNQKPSHLYTTPAHVFPPTDEQSKSSAKAQLDYAAIKKTIDKPAEVSIPTRHRRMTRTIEPDSAEMSDLHGTISSSKFAYKPDVPITELFTTKAGESDMAQANTANTVNTVRRREEALSTNPPHHRTKSGSLSQTNTIKVPAAIGVSHERPKYSQRSASQKSGSHGTNGSTPPTDATEYPWNSSTAPTSAGVTGARNSKRASAHIQPDQDASFRSDSAAMDWIRNEVDKRRKHPSKSRRPSELEKPNTRPPSRPMSRARSIRSMKSVRSIKSITSSMKDNIRDYIRPGTTSRDPSRPASRSASHAAETKSSEYERGQATRPPPRRDWRNWGRSHKEDGGTSGDVSRSNSTRGRTERRKGSSVKPEVNLNRELPPLPSLTQWVEPERERPPHIVNMQSPRANPIRDNQAPPAAPLTRILTRSPVARETDDFVAARMGSPIKPKPEVYLPTRPHKPSLTNLNAAPYLTTGIAKTTDTDREDRSGDMRIEFTINDLIGGSNVPTPAHSYSRSTNSARQPEPVPRPQPTPPSRSEILDGHSRSASSISHSDSEKQSRFEMPVETPKSSSTLATTAPSFSKHRKYDKMDIPPALNSNMANQGRKVTNNPRDESQDAKYCHVTGVSPPPVPPKDDSKKAWWHVKKQKKQMTWMDQLEKLGIKDGILLNDEVAGSPIVRY